MRRVLAATICAALLGGCESYGDLTSDAYDPGRASQTRFSMDSAECQSEANDVRDFEIEGITGTHEDRHEIFNNVFARCMHRDGYVRRDWSLGVPDPYAFDPTPG